MVGILSGVHRGRCQIDKQSDRQCLVVMNILRESKCLINHVSSYLIKTNRILSKLEISKLSSRTLNESLTAV